MMSSEDPLSSSVGANSAQTAHGTLSDHTTNGGDVLDSADSHDNGPGEIFTPLHVLKSRLRTGIESPSILKPAFEHDGESDGEQSGTEDLAPPSYSYSVGLEPAPVPALTTVAMSSFAHPPPPSPPTYAEAVRTGRLTFVDFAPKCLDDGGIISSPKYERFDLLVARANAWLRLNPTVQACSLETVEYVAEDVSVGRRIETRLMTESELETNGSIHIKILRMWLTPKDFGDSLEPQKLGYINVVPACLDPGGVSRSPTFDTLSATVCKLNIMLKQKPLPGHVLNIESIAQKFRQYGKWMDPDRCHYRDHADIASSRLIIIRLYYQAGAAATAQIDFHDFIPKCQHIQRGGCAPVDIESFGQVFQRAHSWLQQQQHSLLNLQSINYKVKKTRGSERMCTNSDKTLFTSFHTPAMVQVLRVWYSKPEEATSSVTTTGLPCTPSWSRRPAPMHGLLCQTFVPRRLREGGVFGVPQYEVLPDVRLRLTEWVNHNTEFQIISAESSFVKLHDLLRVATADTNDVMPTYFPSTTEGSTWLRVLRVYFTMETYATEGSVSSDTARSEDTAQDTGQTLSDRKQCCITM